MTLHHSKKTYALVFIWATMLSFVLFSGCASKVKEPEQVSEVYSSAPIRAMILTEPSRGVYSGSPPSASKSAKTAPSVTNNDIYTFPSGGSFRPYKQFLVRPDTPVEVSYTLVYFPAQPSTTKLTKQYESVCQMWKSHFYAKDEILGFLNDGEEPIPVYWLLRDVRKPDDTCDNLVRWYDFVRATSLLKKKHRPKGPALVALIEGRVITMDLSGLSDEEDLDRAFSVWKEHIVTPSEKDEQLNAITMVYSAKKALGVLASILQIKS